MSFMNSDGARLYYEIHGKGPAVVFAHGRGGNHLNWWQQIPDFARRYTCVVYDHRGFGLSSDTPDGPGKAAFVEDLRRLLDHLSVEKAHLIGQSMGGWSCLGFALAYPNRTSSLVLTNTTGGIAEPSVLSLLVAGGEANNARKTTQSTFEEREPERAFLLGRFRALNEALNPPLKESRHAFMTGATGPKAADLANLRQPTLFIGGADDELFPPSIISAAARLIPGAQVRILANAGHSAHYEVPEQFNACVEEFFQQVGRA